MPFPGISPKKHKKIFEKLYRGGGRNEVFDDASISIRFNASLKTLTKA